jgi:hypothetical protein
VYLLNFSLAVPCFIWFYLVLFLHVFVAELLVLSMFVEALVCVRVRVRVSLGSRMPITALIVNVTKDMLLRAWQLVDCRWDV